MSARHAASASAAPWALRDVEARGAAGSGHAAGAGRAYGGVAGSACGGSSATW
ncbi:MAG: hypothetical protein H6709_11425 [Kofleriaceae bacterium]|nr:hypothetical protein [Kofleriaceae bacterium]